MSSVLVIAGGSPHAHDFAAIGAALRRVVADSGHDVSVVADPDDAAASLSDADALVMNGLWWRMLGETYDPWRDEHGYTPAPSTRDTLTAFVRDGGGLLAMHATSISFDDWPEWGDLVGGAWQWGVSSHPPLGPVSARVVGDHPVVAGLPAVVDLCDEVYGDLSLAEDIEVLAVARRSDDDDDQPVVWAHRFGDGRVVYDGFGHDVTSIEQPHHARLVRQALTWILEAC